MLGHLQNQESSLFPFPWSSDFYFKDSVPLPTSGLALFRRQLREKSSFRFGQIHNTTCFYELHCFCLHGKAREKPHHPEPMCCDRDLATKPLFCPSGAFVHYMGQSELGILGGTVKGLEPDIVCWTPPCNLGLVGITSVCPNFVT